MKAMYAARRKIHKEAKFLPEKFLSSGRMVKAVECNTTKITETQRPAIVT
jgi:hypothetical protein